MSLALRLVIVLLSVASVAFSQPYTEGPWVYGVDYSTSSAGKAGIVGYVGAGGAVNIPSTLGGFEVVGIFGAFVNKSSITSVTIPSSVTTIGNSAFANCTGMKWVSIPNSVTSIGDGAFAYCSGLTNVTIPNSVTNIGVSAFYYCTGLTSVTIGNGVTSIGFNAFSDCTGLTGVTIPNSVTSIGDGAFADCAAMKWVTIGNGVTSIGGNAFADCTGLTIVTIPNSVTSIGVSAFTRCSGLTSVTIGNGVTSIGDLAFYLCPNLRSVYFLGNMPLVGGNNLFDREPVGTVSYPRGNTTWGASFAGWPTQPYDLPTPQPVLAVEHPAGVNLLSGANPVAFPAVPIGVTSSNRVYTLRNTANTVLSNIAVTKSGLNSADFSLAPPASNSLAAGAATTFSVTFLPTFSGARTAQVSITSNNTNNSPFIINLSGFGIGENLDTDGDGLNDAAEFTMSVLGFDWQSNQPTLVTALYINASRAGLYDSNSIMDLRMNGLMLQKQGGNAVVTFQPQTTADLTQPFTNHGTPITNTIPMPWNKGFLRIQAR